MSADKSADAGRFSNSEKVVKMDPIKDIVRLLKRITSKRGCRPLAALTEIPATTISLRRRHPGGWKLAEVARVLDASAANHRITVDLSSTKPTAIGKGRKPTLAASIHRQTPKQKPASTNIFRRPGRNVLKRKLSPK
jgi:hypothetical protein